MKRLCDKCQWIAKEAPGADAQVAIRQALDSHAVEMLNQGKLPDAVVDKLLATGIDAQTAATIVNELVAQREPYHRAAELLESGLLPEQVQSKLIENGLVPEAASFVVNHAIQCREYAIRERKSAPARIALGVPGLLLLLAGGALMIGNRTGAFPTFPFAGFITMAVGGAFLAAAERVGRATGPVQGP